MSNYQTVGINVVATGNFGNILGEVDKLRNKFQSLKLPKDIGKGFETSLSNVEEKFNKFQSLVDKGVNTKGDFQNLNRAAKELDVALKEVEKDFNKLNTKKVRAASFDTTEIKQTRAEIEKLQKETTDFQNIGKAGRSGVFGESEVARITAMFKEGTAGARNFQNLLTSFKSGNLEQAAAAMKEMTTYATRYREQLNTTSVSGTRGDDLVAWCMRAQSAFEGTDSELIRLKEHLSTLQTNRTNELASGFTKAGNEVRNLTSSVRDYTNSMKDAASATMNTHSQLGMLKTQANYFFGLQNMFNLFRRNIEETFNTVKELDKAMTETAVVTDFSVSDMWSKLPLYTKTANELGATIKGAYETMTLYYQQGLNTDEAFAVGTETMKMARIAGLDYAQTTNMMTAALRGFNMEINETSAQRVNDVYSKLAAITASDTRELGLAMERTASIAHSANMEFGNTTAFLAQMIETTREAPENLGTAMKTIIARFQELKQNPYEISEVEGEEVDYNRIDKALKTIGVDLMDNRDKFRDLDDVFMDISEKWDGLSQTQQRYIATMAAGSRQQSRFLAMVGNYDRLKELTEAAANSEGAANVQFVKTLDSMEAKLNKLRNAWDQFAMGIANNNILKGAVDWGVKALDTVNKLEDGIQDFFGGFNTLPGSIAKSVTSLAALWAAFKVGGKIIDTSIGLLGGFLGVAPKGGLLSGISGRRMAGNQAQAAAISNPIVNAIRAAANMIVNGGHKDAQVFKTNDTNNKGFQYKDFRNTQRDLANIGTNKFKGNKYSKEHFNMLSQGFNASVVSNSIKGFNEEQQRILLKQVPGTRAALERSYVKATENLNVSDAAKQSTIQLRKAISEEMLKPGGSISPNAAINLMGNPVQLARAFEEGPIKKELISATNNVRKELLTEAKTKGIGSDKATKKGQRQARQAWVREQEALRYNPNVKLTPEELKANKWAGATAGATAFGQAVMNAGMALDGLGAHAAGSVLTNLGSTFTSIGLAASGATEGIIALKTALAGISVGPIIAALAPLAAVAAITIHYSKKYKEDIDKIQKDARNVTKTYEKTITETTKNINKLQDSKDTFYTLSQGVDENNNNVSLGTEEYSDYLKIINEIAKMHPELVKGYNANGQAILKNKNAIEEAIKAEKTLQDNAGKEFADVKSLNKLISGRNVTKRWLAGQDKDTTEWNGYTNISKHEDSKLKKDSLAVIDNIKQLKGGEEILSNFAKQYGIKVSDLTKMTEDGIKVIQNNGESLFSQVQKEFGDSEDKVTQELVDSVQNSIAQVGKDTQGLEEVTEPIYKSLSTYASRNHLFDNIPEELKEAGERGLKEISKLSVDEDGKKITGEKMQSMADLLGNKLQDLNGHAQDYQKIMDEVQAAQDKYVQNVNEEEYLNDESVQAAIGKLSTWAAEARAIYEKSGKETDLIIAESFENKLTSIKNFTSEGAALLTEGFNTFSDIISAANNSFEDFQKQIEGGDFYTGADNFKQIFDEIQDGIDNVGRGSQTWWKGAEKLLGENNKNIQEGNFDAAEKQVKALEPMFKEGEEGANAFFDHVSQKSIQTAELSKDLFGEGKTVADLFKVADGDVDLNLNKLTGEQFADLADKLGMSDTMLASMLNKAKQFYDIDFSNIDVLRSALVGAESTVTGLGKTGNETDIYTRQSTFEAEAEAQNYTPVEIKELREDLTNRGVKLVKDADEISSDDMKGYIDGMGIKTGEQFIDKFSQLGFSRDELQSLYSKYGDLNGMESDASFQQMYTDYLNRQQEINADSTEQVPNKLDEVNATLQSIYALLGGLEKDSGEKELENVKNKNGKIDTDAERFAHGLNTNGTEISSEKEYNAIRTNLQSEIDNNARIIGALEARKDQLSGSEQKQAEAQIKAYQEANNWLQKSIEMGDQKWQQMQQEKTAQDELNNSKKEEKTTQDEVNNSKEKEKTVKDKEDTSSVDEKLKKLKADAEGILKSGENPEEARAKILEQAEALGLTQQQMQQLTNQAAAFGASGGIFGTLQPQQNFALIQSGFQDVLNDVQLTDQQLAQLGTSLNSLSPTQLNNLTSTNFAELLGNLNLTETQIKQLEETHPDIAFTADTTQIDQVKEKAEEPTKETKKIKYEAEVTPKETITNKGEKEVKKDKPKQEASGIANNSVTLNTTVSNPEEPKTKIEETIPKENKATVKNSITLSSTVNKGNTQEKIKNANKDNNTNTTSTQSKVINVTANTSQAQSQINSLISKFNKTYTLKYKASGPKSIKVPISATFTGPWTKTVKINKSDAKGQNNYITHRTIPNFGSAAKGRYGRLGPKGKGGLTLTGEKGYEVAWLPSESRSMILGAEGPQMINLPKDAVVYTHEQSREILKKKQTIDAGSHAYNARGSFSYNSNASSSSNKSNNTTTKNVNKAAKTVSKAATDTTKTIGYVSVWWENIARKTEITQRKMDSALKAFEKFTKEMSATLHKTGESLASGGGGGDDYLDAITKYMGYNQAQVDKANSELTELITSTDRQIQAWKTKTGKDDKKANKAAYNTGRANVTKISYKKGKKTKDEYVNLSPYIKEENGTYVIDQNKINAIGNVDKRKAVAEAANKEINDRLSKKYAAEDNIQKAQEAIEKMAEELYNTFFAWENELTKIWNLTKKIEATENNISRNKEFQDTLSKQLATGFANPKDSNYRNKTMEAFKQGLQESTDKIRDQVKLVEEQKDALQRTLNIEDERTTLASVQEKLNARYKLDEETNKAKTVLDSANANLSSAQQRKTNAQNQITALQKQKKKAKKKSKKNQIQKQIDAAQKTLNQANSDIGYYQQQVNNATAAYNKAVAAATQNLSNTEKLAYEEYAKKLNDTIEAQTAAQKYLNITRNADGTVKVEFDTTTFEKDKLKGLFTEERGKAIQEYVKEITETNAELSDAYKNANASVNELYDELSQLQDEWADYANELWDISEAETKKEIDIAKNLSSAITDALKNLLDEVKRKLDERRKQEDNAKTERDISQKQQRLAALRADTAGGNQVEIAQLEKEIADAQQDYQRSLEDQLLDRLQQQADLAAEQRERQIEIQEAISEGVNNAALVDLWMSDPQAYYDEMYEAYKTANEYDKKPEALRDQLDSKFDELYTGLTTNQDKQTEVINAIDSIQSVIEQLARSLMLMTTDITNAKENGLSLTEAQDLLGASFKDLVEQGGYTLEDFVASGISYANARSVFSLDQLKENEFYSADAQKELIDTAKANLDKAWNSYYYSNKSSVDAFDKAKTEAEKLGIDTSGYNTNTKTQQQKNAEAAEAERKRKEAEAAAQRAWNAKVQAYNDAISAAHKKKTVTKGTLADAINKGAAIGYNAATVAKALASGDGSGGVTWEEVAKAAKKAGYSRTTVANWAPNSKALKKATTASKWKSYKQGGLANFTGPAWLDGTPSKPELVLNAADTKNFLALRDVLSKAISSTNSVDNSVGDASFEININVDHINNDYDVDRIAERVKKDIVKSAGYRNVTQVRNFK